MYYYILVFGKKTRVTRNYNVGRKHRFFIGSASNACRLGAAIRSYLFKLITIGVMKYAFMRARATAAHNYNIINIFRSAGRRCVFFFRLPHQAVIGIIT